MEEEPRIRALFEADQRWTYNRGSRAAPAFPMARFVPLYTFTRLLIRQVALECGYSSASAMNPEGPA